METVWKDPASGLTWELKAPAVVEEEYSVAEAHAYAAGLNGAGFGGFDDWRVPTLEELASLAVVELFDYRDNYAAWRAWYDEHAHALINNYFIHPALAGNMGLHGWYWSATAKSEKEYYLVNFKDGNVNDNVATQVYYLRCVRG